MKRLFVFAFLFITLAGAHGQIQWSFAARGGSLFNDTVHDVATSTGYAGTSRYVVGSFCNSTLFGSHLLIAEGDGIDIFVAKMDPDGTWAWAYRAGGQYDDEALDVAIDGLGYIYVTGHFQDVAGFGSSILNSYGGANPDIFVWKLDINGLHQWARSAGSNGGDFGCGVSCDNSGNCYLTGSIDSHAYFGSVNLLNRDGVDDIFVAKIDPNGTWLWASGAGSASGTFRSQRGLAIHTVYTTGDSYVTGYAEGPVWFGATSYGTSDGGMNIFVARIANWGGWDFPAHVVAGTGYDTGRGIWADAAGNVFITGDFGGTCSFGYQMNLISAGGQDIFIAKVGADMVFDWARRAGGPGDDSGTSLSVSNALYVGGHFCGQAWFGGSEFQSAGDTDIFASKLDTTGNWLCTRRAGGLGPDRAAGVSTSFNLMNYTVTLAGSFALTADFGSLSLNSSGAWDAFVAGPVFIDQAYGPAQPKNLILAVLENDAVLCWDPVVIDTNGDHHPADYYTIYYSEDPGAAFAAQGATTLPSYTHEDAAVGGLPGFYFVKAHYYGSLGR